MAVTGPTDVRRWLGATATIAAAVNRPASLPELLDLVARTAAELMGYDFCAVLLPDPSGRFLHIEGSSGLSAAYVRQVNEQNPVSLDPEGQSQAPSSRAYWSRSSTAVQDVLAEAGFLPWGGVAREQGYRSMIAMPLLVSEESVGTLNCYRRAPHEYGVEEVELLEMLAAQAAGAITSARQQELDRYAARIHGELTAAALRGAGVDGVASTLTELLGREVRIITEVLGDGAADGRGWCTPVRLDSETVAVIWVDGPVDAVTALERRALEQAATVCALELLRRRSTQDAEWRVQGDLVADLITASSPSRGTVLERARRIGHDLTAPHALLLVEPGPATPERRRRELLRMARSCAAEADHPALMAEVGDGLVVLQEAADGHAPGRKAADLHRLMRATASGDPLAVGVSVPCESLSDYPAAFRRVRGAVRLSWLRGGSGGLVKTDRLGVHGLLLQLEDVGEMVRFANDQLRPLREHDASRATALEKTVRSYLRHDLNTAATAAALFVHPNTVGLRIRRAEQLLGYSLTAVAQLAELQVAFSAEEVVASVR